MQSYNKKGSPIKLLIQISCLPINRLKFLCLELKLRKVTLIIFINAYRNILLSRTIIIRNLTIAYLLASLISRKKNLEWDLLILASLFQKNILRILYSGKIVDRIILYISHQQMFRFKTSLCFKIQKLMNLRKIRESK